MTPCLQGLASDFYTPPPTLIFAVGNVGILLQSEDLQNNLPCLQFLGCFI